MATRDICSKPKCLEPTFGTTLCDIPDRVAPISFLEAIKIQYDLRLNNLITSIQTWKWGYLGFSISFFSMDFFFFLKNHTLLPFRLNHFLYYNNFVQFHKILNNEKPRY